MAISTRFRLIIILFLFLGCGRKTITQVEYRTRVDIQRDTIQMPVLVETVIPSPCDTGGILKDFKFETQAGPAKVKLAVENNRIIVKLKTDTIRVGYRSVSDTLFIYRDKITIKKVTPRWAWWLLVVNLSVAACLGIYIYLRK
jgi:hypothetical protein